jgi:hypothetical protein
MVNARPGRTDQIIGANELAHGVHLKQRALLKRSFFLVPTATSWRNSADSFLPAGRFYPFSFSGSVKTGLSVSKNYALPYCRASAPEKLQTRVICPAAVQSHS